MISNEILKNSFSKQIYLCEMCNLHSSWWHNGWNLKGSSNILGPSNQSRPVSIKDNSSIDSKNSPNELNNVGSNYTVLLPI